MPPKESFLMYLSFEELLMRLTPDELRLMVLAIFNYHKSGNDPDFHSNRVLEMCWQPLRSQFERDAEKYKKTCDRNRANGAKGGRPPKKPSGFSENPNNPKKPKKPDTDTDTDTDFLKENNSEEITVFSFDEFWNAYGKKVDRAKCERMYAKVKENDRAKIKTHVPKYVASTPDVQYRKNPQTYLNGKCWNDEIIAPQVQQNWQNNNSNNGYYKFDGNTPMQRNPEEEREDIRDF